MKLKKLQIQKFRCIDDSEEFNIDDITCMVGKNEAGKSALLQSLYRLNPVEEDKVNFDVIEEYPRRELTDYEKIKDSNPANVITSTWEIEKEEKEAIEKIFGNGVLKDNTIIIKKGYSNSKYWKINIDEQKGVNNYIDARQDIKDLIKNKKINSFKNLLSELEAIETKSDELEKFIEKVKSEIPDQNIDKAFREILKKYIPVFVYFADYQKMAGKIALNELKKKKEQGKELEFKERIFEALLDLVGTSIEEIEDISKLETLRAKLEGVSNKLTDEIFEYWSQNKELSVFFDFREGKSDDAPPFNSGQIFETRIKNERHRVSINFDERSTGFIWFFSFLVWFSQVKKNYGENLFILLDEPGLSLHAKAQQDLLRYMNEKLKPHFQIIFTTHSPFMVDPDNLLSVRTIEDVTQRNKVLGTKVGDKVLSADYDTIFPLQAALGYDITQTLFVGKNTLLVEGPSDLLYLKWFSEELRKQNKNYLDPHWVIAPAGGIDKIGSFIALFGGNKLNIAVLTDYHKGQKKKIKNLTESEILKKGHILTADSYVTAEEADIEDIIGRETYIDLVNECYGLSDDKQMPKTKSEETFICVMEEVENYFRTRSDVTAFDFNHYKPSAFLTEKSNEIKSNLSGLDEAYNRFESLFKDINQLLRK